MIANVCVYSSNYAHWLILLQDRCAVTYLTNFNTPGFTIFKLEPMQSLLPSTSEYHVSH